MLLPVALGLAAGAPRRQLLGILLPAVLVVVAFGAWLESTYGASGASLPLAHTARLVAARELSFGACVGGALRGAFAPAAWAIPFSVLGLARLGWRSRPLGAPAVALFGLLTIPIAVILRVQPTDPLFALAWFALALLAADALDIAVPERVGARTRAAAPGLALLALAVAPFVHGDPGGRAVRAELRAWAQETGFAKSKLVLFARDGAGVAAHACGGIVLDARGRTWPAGLAGDEAQLIAAALPDYLLLETSRPALEALRADDELARGYYPVRRFSAAGATELDPATDDLPAVASADWLLFRRGL
jgi:hypothetical protein